MLVEHRGEIPPAASDRDIRQIADPDLVHGRRHDVPNSVGVLRTPAMRPARAPIDPRGPRTPPTFTHETFDASMTELVSPRFQRAIHPRTPIRPAAALEDRTHLFEQYPVLPRVRARRPLPPRVVPRSRHAKEPTEPRHTEPRPFLIDERERVGFRAEVNRMSFFSSACSSTSNACARCRA